MGAADTGADGDASPAGLTTDSVTRRLRMTLDEAQLILNLKKGEVEMGVESEVREKVEKVCCFPLSLCLLFDRW